MRVLPWEGINPGLPQWVLEMAGCLYKTKPRPIIPATRSPAPSMMPRNCDSSYRKGWGRKIGGFRAAWATEQGSFSEQSREGGTARWSRASQAYIQRIENRDLMFRWRPTDQVWPMNGSDPMSHPEISPTEGFHRLPWDAHRRPQNCSGPILGFQSQNCELSK